MDQKEMKLQKLQSLLDETEDLAEELGIDPAELDEEKDDSEEDES